MTSQSSDFTSNSAQVQGTNDNSIVSKLSMVTQGYLEDKYLKYFVQKPQRRSPIINRGYYIRSKAVRHVLAKFLSARSNEDVQIVSLGAGFDTTFFNIRDLMNESATKHLKYIEIDYPSVISRKVKLAQAADLLEGQNLQNDKNIIYRNENYCAVGFDLRKVGAELAETLQNCGINFTVPTLFLSEVVMTYLTSGQSRNIIKWINHSFRNAVLVVFEQMLPTNGFGEVMLRHFETCGSPLLAIRDYPTLLSQKKRHNVLGFKTVVGVDMVSFYQCNVSSEEKEKIQNIEPFDEYEAWHQTCLHYFIMCSTNSEEESVQEFCKTCLKCHESEKPEVKAEEVSISCKEPFSSIQMFGHCASSVATGNKDLEKQVDDVILFGGFGLSTQNQRKKDHHRRLHDGTLLNIPNNNLKTLTPSNIEFKTPMYSSIVQKPNHEKTQFLLFGGRSSPKMTTNDVSLITINKNCTEHDIKLIPSQGTCPNARWRHTANVLQFVNNCEDDQHTMLVYGGRDELNVHGDCWCLNMNTFIWSNVESKVGEKDIVLGRHSHSAVKCGSEKGDILFISGGLDCNEEPLNDVLSLKMLSHSKALIDRVDIHPKLPQLYSHTSHIHTDRYLILVGGVQFPTCKELHENPNSLADQVFIIDLSTNAWIRTVTLKKPFGLNSLMLHGHCSFVFGNNS
uniref:tRNA wybutosine-synthesizing protein 4 n=1 Tax=Phallusia mammillata TaxID=59560 RepID=A0A6F9DKB8_9ASCI|nr:tRNA wybutosine-synthesizing protein 4 [Phallusia mammillata]